MKKVPCLVYSRVVGYYSPTMNWNLGKRAEFADRKPYDPGITKEFHDMKKVLIEEGVIVK